MQNNRLLLLLLIVMPGCAQLGRPLTDASLAAGGAAIGNQLSHGNPLATAGGAAAGALLGEGVYAWKTSSERRAYVKGFEKGRSDGVKLLYWNLQAGQRNWVGPEFEVTVPQHKAGGVLFNETKQNIK